MMITIYMLVSLTIIGPLLLLPNADKCFESFCYILNIDARKYATSWLKAQWVRLVVSLQWRTDQFIRSQQLKLAINCSAKAE